MAGAATTRPSNLTVDGNPARAKSRKQTKSDSPFSQSVRAWRNARKLSQMELALRAGVSPRHICFLENGRARPSRVMVLTIADALEMSLREQNRLLLAAGFAPRFQEADFFGPEMAHVRQVVAFILERHEPFGSAAIDAGWRVLVGNNAFWRTIEVFSDGAIQRGDGVNLLEVMAHENFRAKIVNWEEASLMMSRRLHREALEWKASAPNEQVQPPWAEILSERESSANLNGPHPLMIPIHLRYQGRDIRIFSTITTLGTPIDVTLQELRIETFFPADAESEAVLRSMGEM